MTKKEKRIKDAAMTMNTRAITVLKPAIAYRPVVYALNFLPVQGYMNEHEEQEKAP